MGALVVQQVVSADGFAVDGDRIFDLIDGDTADFDRSNSSWIDRASAILLGRTTYEQFVAFWPTDAARDELVEAQINSVPKHVFSTSLTEAPWGDFEPATVQSGDAIENVRRLKSEMRGDLIVWGSLTLADCFFAAGEVDVVRLVVLPVAVGAGRTAFPEAGDPVRLALRSTDTFDSGLVELEYTVIG